MKRTWTVRPDSGMELRDGSVIGYVSREALIEAYMDAASIQDRAGGVVTVLCGRVATDVEGEMLTAALVFEWKDRVDATTAPEQASAVYLNPDPEADPEIELGAGLMFTAGDPDPTPEELEASLAAQEETVARTDDNPDGFDTSKLEEEDVSSIPAEAR